MARLPDVTDLGGHPTPQASRSIVNNSVAGRGVSQAADILTNDANRSASGVMALTKGASEVGVSLQDAHARVSAGREAVERVRDLGAYNKEAAEELRRITTEGDLSDLETTDKYGQWLVQKRDEKVAAHKGSEISKLRLSERAEQVRHEYGAQAAVLGTAAQKKMIGNAIDGSINSLAARAGDNTVPLENLFASLDGELRDMDPAMTPAELAAYRNKGQSEILKSKVSKLIALGGFDEAEAIMKNPEYQKIMDSDSARVLNNQVTVKRIAQENSANEFQNKVVGIEKVVGPLNQTQKLRLAGLGAEPVANTPGEKIAKLEKYMTIANGGERYVATPADVQKIFNAVPEGTFGNGLRGVSLKIMSENSTRFAAGTLSPQEENDYIAAVTDYTQQSNFTNPDSGLVETRTPTLPPYVAEAFRRRGMEIPNQVSQAPAAPPSGQPAPAQPPSQAASSPAAPPQGKTQGETIWQRRNNVTGIVPGGVEAAGKTPIVGGFVPQAKMVQDRTFLTQQTNNLVRVLQNNPKFSEGERKSIKDEIDIDPRLFDNSVAFENRILGIDESLQVRQDNAYKTAFGQNRQFVSKAERQHAMDVFNAITQFRETLGVPPRFKTPDEAKKAVAEGKIKPGDEFVTSDGRIKTVPGEPR